MKQIVLFVEGEGEVVAVPKLVGRILSEQNAWDSVTLDKNPFRVGQINRLVKNEYREWKRKLSVVMKRPNVGGVLLVLDGDVRKVGANPFCAADTAKSLARTAKSVGGGSIFSVASVFARQEFESWLIAGFNSFAGKTFPDGRTVPDDVELPGGDLEEGPRDAKGWLRKAIGYRPTRDQRTLTEWLEPQCVRDRGMRSFRRLDSAISQLVAAITSGNHIVTPIDC